jgi:mannitol-1-phosphate/altronate dehydrogenase
MFEKVKVLLNAVPSYGAVVVAAITAVSAVVVPELPGPVGVQVAAYVAAAVAFVQTVVSVVSRVTPVVDKAHQGLVDATESVQDAWGDVA